MKKISQTIQLENLFQPIQLEKDICYHVNSGQLHVWLEQGVNEIRLTHKHQDAAAVTSGLPVDADWTRWAFDNGQNIITIKPVFPDRAIVITPESSFWLLKSTEATIYVRIPVWLRFILGGEKGQTLTELPTRVLSNTWFGSFSEGELCLWHLSDVSRTIDRSPEKMHLVICPLHLINQSEEDLLVDRICLRVNRLKMYSGGGNLWSDTTTIIYKGKNEKGEITMSGKAPDNDLEYTLLSAPRYRARKSFVAKSFQTLKELPGLGF